MNAIDQHLREESAFGLAGWVGQSRGMAVAHRHLDLEINYVLSGSMIYLAGGRIVELPLRRLCLLWGGVPHQMMQSAQAVEAIWVTVPLAIVLRWGLPEDLIRPLLATGFLADRAPRSGDQELLNQWMSDLPHPRERASGERQAHAGRQIVLLEIEARLRRFAQGLLLSPRGSGEAHSVGAQTSETIFSEPVVTAHADRGFAAVEAMARFVAANYRNSVGVAEISGAAHLHPNYAMTLFRRHTGMTLSQYLVLQRVAHAQRLLATTDEGIAAIGLESGFGSVSRFYEAFRQQTGKSPRRFRLQMEPSANASPKA